MIRSSNGWLMAGIGSSRAGLMTWIGLPVSWHVLQFLICIGTSFFHLWTEEIYIKSVRKQETAVRSHQAVMRGRVWLSGQEAFAQYDCQPSRCPESLLMVKLVSPQKALCPAPKAQPRFSLCSGTGNGLHPVPCIRISSPENNPCELEIK